MSLINKEYCLDSEYLDEQILDTFGKYLMTDVRDKAIDSYVSVINKTIAEKDEESEDYQRLKSFDEEQMSFLMRLIPYLVDSALFYLLSVGITEEEHRVVIMVGAGGPEKRSINELSDEIGEGLVGDLIAEDGWIARFSQRDTFFNDVM